MKRWYLIRGGRVIDPAQNVDEILDIAVSEGKIEKAGKGLSVKDAEVIDAKGLIVVPGLIDMHVHLREPGREDEETVKSGTHAALHGGFTGVLCMPNTEPPLDDPQAIKNLKAIIARDALCNVYIAAATTTGRLGRNLSDLEKLKMEGVLAVTDDGSAIQDSGLMEEALKKASLYKLLLIEHCEDAKLSSCGVMNRGFISTKLGLRGISSQSEYEMVKRNVELAKKAGSRIHIAHVSCKESVEIIRKAKQEKINVTAETAPHYFTLTDECCASYDTNTKMNPPLRGREDIEVIKAGLADGTIDVIATDHAPHTDSEKGVEFDYAPFGITGLETALSLGLTELVEKSVLTLPQLISKMSTTPAKILGMPGGSLKEGGVADITIIDPKEYVFTRDSIKSKSKNSPFIDWKLKGRAVIVFVNGNIVMRE